MEWTREQMYALIAQYEKFDCLWNVNVPRYKKLNLKKDAWRDIGSALNVSASEAELKMQSLLAAYRREKRKVRESKKSGSGTDAIYTPKWFASDSMKFMHHINRPRKNERVTNSHRGKICE